MAWRDYVTGKDSDDFEKVPVQAEIDHMPLTELSYAQWAHVEDLLKYRSETVYTKYFVEDVPLEELSESQ